MLKKRSIKPTINLHAGWRIYVTGEKRENVIVAAVTRERHEREVGRRGAVVCGGGRFFVRIRRRQLVVNDARTLNLLSLAVDIVDKRFSGLSFCFFLRHKDVYEVAIMNVFH